MTALRVLHMLHAVGSGGVERRRHALACHPAGGAVVHAVVCEHVEGELPASLAAHGWAVHAIGAPRGIGDPLWYARAYRIARAFRPDIVHGAVYEGNCLAAVVGTLLRRPVICEETSDPVGRRLGGHLLLRLMLLRARKVVAVSEAVERYLADTLRIPAGKRALIRNAVPEPCRRAAGADGRRVREACGIGPAAFVVGAVGRLRDDHKRISDLLRAAALAADPELHVLVVGDGPDRAMLEALAAGLGLAGRVTFAGYQADPGPFYEAMDVFVLPSAHEAFGLVLVEAMFAQVPVVATAVGGIPEVVVDGETGCLVPPFAPAALAQALAVLKARPDVRARFGAAGQRRARQRFAADRYVRDVLDLYAGLARGPA